jgi:hypothetical protein
MGTGRGFHSPQTDPHVSAGVLGGERGRFLLVFLALDSGYN